ncbi:MAG TPA: DNA/RNA non-specific endonuclease [Pyrinomonadaceae bacterium]|nr:DNA/RNA non-specific endonuclease [Pyrinomonadaceae bacterium]
MRQPGFVLVLIFILSAFVFAQNKPLDFGNPSNATDDTKKPVNFLVVHNTFTLSYNRPRGSANWVAWHLDASNLGDEDRSNAFAPDTMLPEPWRISEEAFPGLEEVICARLEIEQKHPKQI